MNKGEKTFAGCLLILGLISTLVYYIIGDIFVYRFAVLDFLVLLTFIEIEKIK